MGILIGCYVTSQSSVYINVYIFDRGTDRPNNGSCGKKIS